MGSQVAVTVMRTHSTNANDNTHNGQSVHALDVPIKAILEMQEQELADLGSSVSDSIMQRILHTLSIYPKLSPSMLQVGIGTGMSPQLWHPVLEQMVIQGLVRREQVAAQNPVTKRDQTYTIISIPEPSASK